MSQEYSKYFIWSLTKDKLTTMMMRAVKDETKWVQDTTYEACMTCPNLTEAQKETNLALEEEIEI